MGEPEDMKLPTKHLCLMLRPSILCYQYGYYELPKLLRNMKILAQKITHYTVDHVYC